ncbi:PO113 protein, partial [Polioptila caerulea]|nr:PO113 protein [Polioptila caerulea]NWS34841.1 PO113 protein [Polioptila caerulea]
KEWDWITVPSRSKVPLRQAVTVFTDARKKSRKATATWKEGTSRKHQMIDAEPTDSLQTLELAAVAWTIAYFTGPLNVVTDSLYVAGVMQRIEGSMIREVQNKRLYELLLL